MSNWVYEVKDELNDTHDDSTIVFYKNKEDAIKRFDSMVKFHCRYEPQNFNGIIYNKEVEVSDYDDSHVSGLPYAEFIGSETSWFIRVTARKIHNTF